MTVAEAVITKDIVLLMLVVVVMGWWWLWGDGDYGVMVVGATLMGPW